MLNSPDIDPSTHANGTPSSALTNATHVLYVFDKSGAMTGLTKEYKTYQTLKQAYLNAKATYATAYATAMSNAPQLQVWPVTSTSLQAAVDNAYSEWRVSNADKIENAIEIVKNAGALK